MGTGDDKNLFPQDQDGKVIQDRNTDLLSLWKVHVFNAFKIRISNSSLSLVIREWSQINWPVQL